VNIANPQDIVITKGHIFCNFLLRNIYFLNVKFLSKLNPKIYVMIQLENMSNYNHGAFCKPSHLKKIVFKFNNSCGSHFMAYLKR